MDENQLLKVFNTMHFTDGVIKEARLVKDNTIYIIMFNEPDLIFEFNSMIDWSVSTAKNYIERKDKEKNGTVNND
jgi:hypothetical protein